MAARLLPPHRAPSGDLGFFARCAGTLFIDRRSRASTEETARRMEETLAAGVPVLLFPEGTSSDGSTVLRFHPSLFEPAVRLGAAMTPAAIAYRARGAAERELCWFGDAGFTAHFVRTLGYAGLHADIDLHPDRVTSTERKSAALEAHEKVEAMRRRMRTF